MTISAYLLCVGGQSLIISVQEGDSIWIILAMEIDCQINMLVYNIGYYSTIAF